MMEFVPLLQWSLVLAVLSALGAPIAAVVFRPLARRGAAFSLPVALVVFAVAVFWLGQVTYGRHTVVAGAGVLAACSALAWRYGGGPDWRAVAGGSGVFFLGFALYLTFAAHGAAITPVGGEQFLHYGLSKSLIGADALPPEDFWWAGEPVRYYYGTQLQVASLSLLSGVDLRFGFYLALGTFYGVLFVSAYGLVGSILANHGRPYRLGGAFGAFFVALAGSSMAFLRLSFEFFPAPVRDWTGQALFGAIAADRPETFQEAVRTQGSVSEWSWWNARYVVEGTLQEFPLYSFVKADLHGHSLSTGYVLLAAAVGLSYYHTPPEDRPRRLALVFGGLGLLAGLFGFMNTWALPTAVGLAWLAMAAAVPHPATLSPGGDRVAIDGAGSARRLGAEAWRLVTAALLAVPVGLVGVLVASPFLLGGVPTNGGVGVFPPQTDIGPFLAVYGGLLALFGALLFARLRATADRREAATLVVAVAVLVTVPLAVPLPLTPAVLAAVGPPMLVTWWLVRTYRLGYEAVLLVGGLGLLLSLELVHAEVWPPDRVRWNTALKVAVQAWTLAAAAGGAAAALLVSGAVDRLRELRTGSRTGGVTPPSLAGNARLDGLRSRARAAAPAVLAVALVCAVVLTSLPFVLLTANGNVGGEPSRYLETPTEGSIDALAVHDRWKGDRMDAIYWLDEQGKSTVVEAPSRSNYRWQNAASVFSGAVTVAGWNHQAGYRGEEVYGDRARSVDLIYVGPWDTAVKTLREHGVEYVYVGEGERDRYGDEMRVFDVHSGVSVAFENDAVTIYAVNRTALDPDERSLLP